VIQPPPSPPVPVAPEPPVAVVSEPAPPPSTTERPLSRAGNVDGLIVQLEQLRTQKAELERQEKEIVAELRQLLKLQRDRLDRLGIAATELPREQKP
jgi:hypothetical protein